MTFGLSPKWQFFKFLGIATMRSNKQKKRTQLPQGFWLPFFVISIFSFLELFLLFSLLSFDGKVIAHLFLSVILLFFLLFLLKRQKNDPRFLLVFALFMLPLGPQGALVIFVSLLVYLIYIKITEPLVDLLSSLIPTLERDESEIVYERILYHLDDFHPEQVPIPFRDIMSFGTYKQKRMAIDKMLRYYEPDFAPILKMGLEDPSSAVKVQAATAIGYIDQKMFSENIRLKDMLEKDPDNLQRLKHYAEHTENYVLTDLLDKDRSSKMLKLAIQSYQKYLEKEPEDKKALFSLARLFYLSGDDSLSKQILERLLKRTISKEVAFLMLHVLYRLKEIDALQDFAKLIESKFDKDSPQDNFYMTVKFWSQEIPFNLYLNQTCNR